MAPFKKTEEMNEDVKRFKQIANYHTPSQSLRQINEYTFITTPQLNEEGEDDDDAQNQEQGQQPQMGGDMSNAPQGNIPQQGGNEQPDDQQMGGMDTNIPQQNVDGEEGMGDNTPEQGGQEGDMSMGFGDEEDAEGEEAMGDETDSMEPRAMEDGDEVVDIDDLTQSQQATEYKVDGVDDRLAKLYKEVQKFNRELEANSKHIMALKQEFEKRNPTQIEKLNLRSQSSFPYTETPKDFWKKKVKTNRNYDVSFDNGTQNEDDFDIREKDIEGINMREISDTLNANYKLDDYLKF